MLAIMIYQTLLFLVTMSKQHFHEQPYISKKYIFLLYWDDELDEVDDDNYI